MDREMDSFRPVVAKISERLQKDGMNTSLEIEFVFDAMQILLEDETLIKNVDFANDLYMKEAKAIIDDIVTQNISYKTITDEKYRRIKIKRFMILLDQMLEHTKFNIMINHFFAQMDQRMKGSKILKI